MSVAAVLALKALRAVLLASVDQVDAVLAVVGAPQPQLERLACPHCGNAHEDKLEPTPDLKGGNPHRVTCLKCGKSFQAPPPQEEGTEEVTRG